MYGRVGGKNRRGNVVLLVLREDGREGAVGRRDSARAASGPIRLVVREGVP